MSSPQIIVHVTPCFNILAASLSMRSAHQSESRVGSKLRETSLLHHVALLITNTGLLAQVYPRQTA